MNATSSKECADALCTAQGFSLGSFIKSSNDFCTSHFEYLNDLKAPYFAYSLNADDVYYGKYDKVAIITADCTPSGRLLSFKLETMWGILSSNINFGKSWIY